MSKRIDDVSLLDMLAYAKKVRALTSRVPRSEFDADEVHQAAVAHWLQTIGEAANRLPKAFHAAQPEIDWRNIIGLRNVIVHRYTELQLDKLWIAATDGIDNLIPALERLLAR